MNLASDSEPGYRHQREPREWGCSGRDASPVAPSPPSAFFLSSSQVNHLFIEGRRSMILDDGGSGRGRDSQKDPLGEDKTQVKHVFPLSEKGQILGSTTDVEVEERQRRRRTHLLGGRGSVETLATRVRGGDRRVTVRLALSTSSRGFRGRTIAESRVSIGRGAVRGRGGRASEFCLLGKTRLKRDLCVSLIVELMEGD